MFRQYRIALKESKQSIKTKNSSIKVEAGKKLAKKTAKETVKTAAKEASKETASNVI